MCEEAQNVVRHIFIERRVFRVEHFDHLLRVCLMLLGVILVDGWLVNWLFGWLIVWLVGLIWFGMVWFGLVGRLVGW